jgi:hypothetical protein
MHYMFDLETLLGFCLELGHSQTGWIDSSGFLSGAGLSRRPTGTVRRFRNSSWPHWLPLLAPRAEQLIAEGVFDSKWVARAKQTDR